MAHEKTEIIHIANMQGKQNAGLLYNRDHPLLNSDFEEIFLDSEAHGNPSVLHNNQLKKDYSRSNHLFPKNTLDDDFKTYITQLRHYNARTYMQGDMHGANFLCPLIDTMIAPELVNELQVKVQKTFFSYLRKDGSIGGVTLYSIQKPYPKILAKTIVKFSVPKNCNESSLSLNSNPLFNAFLAEDVATGVFRADPGSKPIRRIKKSAGQAITLSDMNKNLSELIDNDEIFEIVQNYTQHPELLKEISFDKQLSTLKTPIGYKEVTLKTCDSTALLKKQKAHIPKINPATSKEKEQMHYASIINALEYPAKNINKFYYQFIYCKNNITNMSTKTRRIFLEKINNLRKHLEPEAIKKNKYRFVLKSMLISINECQNQPSPVDSDKQISELIENLTLDTEDIKNLIDNNQLAEYIDLLKTSADEITKNNHDHLPKKRNQKIIDKLIETICSELRRLDILYDAQQKDLKIFSITTILLYVFFVSLAVLSLVFSPRLGIMLDVLFESSGELADIGMTVGSFIFKIFIPTAISLIGLSFLPEKILAFSSKMKLYGQYADDYNKFYTLVADGKLAGPPDSIENNKVCQIAKEEKQENASGKENSDKQGPQKSPAKCSSTLFHATENPAQAVAAEADELSKEFPDDEQEPYGFLRPNVGASG